MEKESKLRSDYNIYLRLEKSLSANSVDAYQRDVDKLFSFAEGEGVAIEEITYEHLQQFVAQLQDLGIHPRSQARIVSGIKSFFHFLVVDGYLQNDPTELLESPNPRIHELFGVLSRNGSDDFQCVAKPHQTIKFFVDVEKLYRVMRAACRLKARVLLVGKRRGILRSGSLVGLIKRCRRRFNFREKLLQKSVNERTVLASKFFSTLKPHDFR